MNRQQERTGPEGMSPLTRMKVPGVEPAELGARLQRLERLAALGTLSAGAAHEIKNALVPVKTFIGLLLEENPNSELAVIVQRELARINLLVAQMLKLARPGAVGVARVDLHAIINDSLRLIHHQARDKSIAVETNFDAQSDSVMGDSNQLEQVFLNIFFNAIEAMDENGRLSVKTDLTLGNSGQPRLMVTISDTGIGMTEAEIARLFEPFFSTKSEGTGLGLVIANEIITEHGGTISVRSRRGEGTTFSLSLPAGSSK